jgi:hypothetical protein
MANALTNFELIDIIKTRNLEKHFGGVYSKDQLPGELIKDKFYIVNLQDHDEGGGTHWTCFYYNYPSTSIYFDSYGFIAPRDVQKRISPYVFIEKDIQDFNSSACGWYCIAFIKFLHDKTDKEEMFKTFLKLFKLETIKNDKILQEMLNR